MDPRSWGRLDQQQLSSWSSPYVQDWTHDMRTHERRICSLGLAGLLLLAGCDARNPALSSEGILDLQTSSTGGSLTLSVGESATITPPLREKNNKPVNPRSLTWSSTNPAVASVGPDGVVTGLSAGETLVVASSSTQVYTTAVEVVGNGGSSRLTISPESLVLTWIGEERHLAAVVEVGGDVLRLSSAAAVEWKSLNPEVAQVDDVGNVTARSIGAALIVATSACCADADSVSVEVVQAPATVVVEPEGLSLLPGAQANLIATVRDSGSVVVPGQTVSWSSNNQAIVRVDSTGALLAADTGTAVITARSGSLMGTSIITVTTLPPVEPPPVVPPASSTGGVAELPRVWVNTDWVEPTGKTIFVPAGGDLQGAINSAQRGDVIELQAGATYTGNFTLPEKPGSGWIVIRTRGTLPPPGTRVTPANAAQLAKLVSTRGSSDRVLTAASGATHYRIVGLEIAYATTVTTANAIVDMKNGSKHIILDRSYVHGHPNMNLQRCVLMHAEHAAVIDSWLSACHYKGADSQAILAFNTNGPLKIVNNHLEGAGENIMFGGATPSANTMPADIEIRRNHFFKPDSWRLPDGTSRWTVKNLFEIKFAERVLLEANVFDGNWKDAQDGHAFNIKLSAAGSGDRVRDITLRYNILRRTDLGIKLVSPATRVVIEHNLLLVDGTRLFTILSGTQDVHLLFNTGRHTGNIITSTAGTYGNRRFIARGNIWGSSGGYGVKGGGAEGTSTLNADFPEWVYYENVHIGRVASRYPANNHFVQVEEDVGFVSAGSGDYRLRAGSPFAGMGADIDRVQALTAGVVR